MQAARWSRTQLIHGRTLCFALGQSPPVDRSAPRATAVPSSGRTACVQRQSIRRASVGIIVAFSIAEESRFTSAQTNPGPARSLRAAGGFMIPWVDARWWSMIADR